MSPAHIHTRQPHLTYVLPLWPLYTLTQQEPTIDHAKTVVGPQGFTQEPTKKGKENKSYRIQSPNNNPGQLSKTSHMVR
jgi:hypothetical protein